jgi:hypothetical protein
MLTQSIDIARLHRDRAQLNYLEIKQYQLNSTLFEDLGKLKS